LLELFSRTLALVAQHTVGEAALVLREQALGLAQLARVDGVHGRAEHCVFAAQGVERIGAP
jgi:hypothetical protein